MSEKATHCMYYIAIVCPAAINEKVLQHKLWMQQHFGCNVALKSPAHITLVAPFYFEEAKETQLKEALQLFSFQESPVTIELNGFSHFGKRVIFIQVNNNPILEILGKQLNIHLHHLLPDTIKEESRPFNPHVTIANRDVKPSVFEKAWKYFSEKRFEEIFDTNTVSILKLTEGKWHVISEINR